MARPHLRNPKLEQFGRTAAFTVAPGGRVLVSADVCGAGADEVLVRHHNRDRM